MAFEPVFWSVRRPFVSFPRVTFPLRDENVYLKVRQPDRAP